MVLSGITFVAVAALGQTPCKSGCSAGWEFAGPATYVDRGDDLKISNAGAINNVVNSHWDKKNWFGKQEKTERRKIVCFGRYATYTNKGNVDFSETFQHFFLLTSECPRDVMLRAVVRVF